MAKLTKSEKKKRAKVALKELLNNQSIINRFRVIFKMYDYSDKDVQKTIKAMIKGFLETSEVDPEMREIEELINYAPRRQQESIADEIIDMTPRVKSDRPAVKVVKKHYRDNVEDLLNGF